MPLPLSGRTGQPGSVAATEQSSPTGVTTISSGIQVTGDYEGSVVRPEPGTGPLTLTMADAVSRGLKTNLAILGSETSTQAARAQRVQQLSVLLPSISANASETVSQVNLAAYGFQFKAPPGMNFSIPTVVGPFAFSQLQGSLSESFVDLVSRRNWQATKDMERAAVLSAQDARQLVTLAVSGSYFQTLATASLMESQRAQVENANAIYNQALARKSAGTNAKIDVMRSLVELQTQQQRMAAIASDVRKQKISLARLIGVPLDRELVLTDALDKTTPALPSIAQCTDAANRNRPDLRALEAQLRAAQKVLSAAHAERLPSVSLNGDYGVLGTNPTSTHGVFSITGSVNIPIWQGGRVSGDIQAAEATLRQRQSELSDQRSRIEQEVRNALIELETAVGQVRLATTNRGYAEETLSEARDRFGAGIANTVEVTQAQEQVAGAESDYVNSLFALNLAKVTLARATGTADITTAAEGVHQ